MNKLKSIAKKIIKNGVKIITLTCFLTTLIFLHLCFYNEDFANYINSKLQNYNQLLTEIIKFTLTELFILMITLIITLIVYEILTPNTLNQTKVKDNKYKEHNE